MPTPKGYRRVNLVVRADQDRELDRVARQLGKSRSDVVRDAIDRITTVVPDVDAVRGTHLPK